jgi:cyclophilin family peptidyl-prolyl cis-trans isomerase
MLARLLLLVAMAFAQATPFKTPYSADEMRNKQAVVDTDLGSFVIQLLPEAAPNHVGHFMKLARDGAYVGTTFHRVIRYGIVQGGDPLTKDPSKSAQYGTGGLGKIRAEISAEKHTAGAVAAVLIPNQPDSGGDQFFIDASDQPALDGQYTIFGRVVEGIEVVQAISAVDADAEGRPAKRIVIKAVTIRDTPPPVVPRFSTETAAELAAFHATLDTTMGEIEIEFLTTLAPEHARNFLQLANAGVYDGVLVHRVVKGFVVQTGAIAFRQAPLTPAQQKLVHNLQPEFSNTPNLPGIVSMARGDDPASATTSFFICIGECRTLDSKYTVFARVVRGVEVLKAMEAVEVDGETPKGQILVKGVTISKKQ